ncbi:hypothetical protein DRH27_02995 [Candidatus Falkowbacteria bacterium]|nr:MAG: hypothetical protein DRH27_02995 [Candidatus Falkowbacteria bacterium]
MTNKKFKIIRLFIVITMTIAIGIAVNRGIAFVPPLAMVLSAGLILLLFKRVDEVVVDERDYKLGGQAARITFNITATALTGIGGSLVAYGIKNPYYYRFGYLLLYLVTFMLVVNIIAFLYYQSKGEK